MRTLRLIGVTGLVAALGCKAGLIGDTSGILPGQGQEELCTGTPNVAVSPMRRLSNLEYQQTVGDLLGLPDVARQVTANFVSDPESLGFHNGAEFLNITTPVAQQYADAADTLSAAAVAQRWSSLIQCGASETERACAQRFVGSFGQRAYRRPLQPTEVDAVLTKVYDTARTQGYDFQTGIEWVIGAFLQSSNFLHRVELVPADGTPQRVTGYEMASRLSYLVWGSAPDDALLAAAASGALDQDAGVADQAARLLDDARAQRIFDFYAEWLDLDRLPTMERDPAVFGPLDPNLATLLRQETQAFVNHVLWEEDGTLDTLLTAPYTYMNGALATHYGIAGISGTNFRQVPLDPTKRAGLLMQTSVLTAHDKVGRTSIVRRGLKVRTDVLCGTVGSPPNNAVLDLPPTAVGVSQKETLEQHRTNATCNACHSMMDPLGAAFETVDAVGRMRTKDEAGNVIDPSSQLTFSSNDGPVSGATDLVARLAATDDVQACFTTQLFRYAYGRKENKKADGCSQERLQQDFAASGHNLRAAILALTKTDAFLYRAAN